jgi:hypothetical protein
MLSYYHDNMISRKVIAIMLGYHDTFFSWKQYFYTSKVWHEIAKQRTVYHFLKHTNSLQREAGKNAQSGVLWPAHLVYNGGQRIKFLFI